MSPGGQLAGCCKRNDAFTGNDFSSEALPNSLPPDQNNPRVSDSPASCFETGLFSGTQPHDIQSALCSTGCTIRAVCGAAVRHCLHGTTQVCLLCTCLTAACPFTTLLLLPVLTVFVFVQEQQAGLVLQNKAISHT